MSFDLEPDADPPKVLVIGPDSAGNLPEFVVLVLGDDRWIAIHAMKLRRQFYERPMCPRHHHVVHDDGWTLELDQHRTITIRQPDGTVWAVQRLTGLRHRQHPPPPPEPDRQPHDQSEFALLA